MKKFLLIVFAITTLISCTTQKDVNLNNYPIVTTIKELSEYYDLKIDTTGIYETANITKYFDGSFELEYSYELLESEKYDPLIYSLTFLKEASIKDAKQSFTINKGALKLVGNSFEQGTIEIDSLKLPGDESYYALRTLNGEPSGMFYMTRKGKSVCTMIISGMYTTDHSLIYDLLIPKNKNLEKLEIIKNE
jgi:hypothetical protein